MYSFLDSIGASNSYPFHQDWKHRSCHDAQWLMFPLPHSGRSLEEVLGRSGSWRSLENAARPSTVSG